MEPLRQRFVERAARDLGLLRRHLADDDLGSGVVESTVHKLAGSAALFGFADIGEAAREIDRVFSAGRRPEPALLERLLERLTAAGSDAGAAAEPAPAAPPAAGDETILVVEDDYLLRAHTERALRGLGYPVVCAADADEALVRLAATPAVRLLFTDLMLPGPMDGAALAREVRRRRPEVRVLLASGKAAPENPPSGAHFLAKPYRREALAAKVREALDDATTPSPEGR